jgi:hypothetical protein
MQSPDANVTTVTDGQCYLGRSEMENSLIITLSSHILIHVGRPWNTLAVTVYLRTYMDESIKPAGFTPWSGE